MNRSEQIGQLVAALAAAQARFVAIGKDRTARIQSTKGTFSYTYADLATVVEATRPALTEQGLAVMQPVQLTDGRIVVTTVLGHKSGEWICEEMSWPVAVADNRSIGSGITYARRHAYLAMVGGAATDEDDDAEQARGGSHDTQRPRFPVSPRREPDPIAGSLAPMAIETAVEFIPAREPGSDDGPPRNMSDEEIVARGIEVARTVGDLEALRSQAAQCAPDARARLRAKWVAKHTELQRG